MATASTPPWQAQHNGLVGDATATALSAAVNQYLGTHADTLIYAGSPVVVPQIPYTETTQNPWNTQLLTQDADQPITLSGTSIGRVTIPVLPVGQGADLLVSLWSDNGSGQPGSVITQARIPASWISQLAPVAGLSASGAAFPTTFLTGNPLVAPQTYTLGFSLASAGPYNYPASTFTGVAASPSTTWYPGYIFWIGGVTGGTALTGVYTVPIDSSAIPGASQVQPVFPTTNDGSSASIVAIDSSTGDPILINCGGGTTYEGPTVATCYASQFDPTNGTLGAWSAQASLPQAMQNHSIGTYNGYVYVVGGRSNATTTLATVYYAQVQNGQISSWSVGPSLPQATSIASLSISPTGVMTVAGGTNAAFTSSYTASYWSQINPATGAPGPWRQGPSLPTAVVFYNTQPYINAYGSFEVATGALMPANQYGQAPAWEFYPLANAGFPGFVDFGNGQNLGYVFNFAETEYGALYTNVMPQVSVPLPATGLTSGATYHVMLQQQGGDINDYLITCISRLGYNVTTGPTAMTSPADTYTWTAATAHYAIPITVYNQATPGAGLNVLPMHTWQDNGARITTFVSATTPDQQLLGLCEASVEAYALNANTGFASGLSPWTGNGGTASTSSTQFYQGGVSAKIIPSGSATQVYLQSETLPCVPGQAVSVSAWMWFTNAVTSNASCSVNWYNAAGTYLSTSSNNVSVPAATWTPLSNVFTAPAGAYKFTINPALSGTPAAAQQFYVDTAIGRYAFTGPQNSTVTQIIPAGTWPNATWPPQGTVQLA